MANQSAIMDDRPSSPESHQPRGSRRERRKSGSKSPGTAEVHELRSLSAARKRHTHHDRQQKTDQLPNSEEHAANDAKEASALNGETTHVNHANAHHGHKLLLRRPRLHSHADGQDDVAGRKDLNIVLHDISQSMWIEDPNDHAAEKVYLTIEAAALDEMLTIDPAMCWIHHERSTQPMQFEDFMRILDNSPGLYPHEHGVAAKVLELAQEKRHSFASGRYFEAMTHQVKEAPEVGGQKTEVRATFVSMPIFCSMQSREAAPKHHHDYSMLRKPFQRIFESIHRLVHSEQYTRRRHHHAANTQLRMRNEHPIRSLMQYANILALDKSRDRQQAVIRLGDDDGEHQSFIHVPEFWALIINNFTIITCAPFAVDHLLGKNITFRAPPPQDRRAMVKYTSLDGALHEFRCRTWVGLLNIISRIEKDINQAEEELSVLLQQGDTEYKLIDTNFCQLGRKQWLNFTSKDSETPSTVFLRLLRVSGGDKFNVVYAEYVLKGDRQLVFQQATFQLMIERARKEVKEARQKHAPTKLISKLELSLKVLAARQRQARTQRIAQRYLLMAVRYHLLDPKGLLFDEDETYIAECRNRTPSRRTPSTLSRNMTQHVSPDLQAKESAPGLGVPSIPQVSTVARPRAESNATPSEDTPPKSSLTDGGGDVRNAAVVQDAVKRFQAPARRVIFAAEPKEAEQAGFRMSQDTVEEINARFQPPRRSRTTQSLIPASSHSLIVQRSWSFNPSRDIEAQIEIRDGPQAVNFAPTGPERVPVPVYTIPAITKQQSTQLRSIETQAVASRGFRRPGPLRLDFSVDSKAITPRRLPAVQELANQVSPTTLATSESTSNEATSYPGDSLVQMKLKVNRKNKDLKRRQPFFEWRAFATTPSTPRAPEPQDVGQSSCNEDGFISPSSVLDGTGSAANRVLDVLNLEMMNNMYQVSEDFPIQPRHYRSVKEKTLNEVIQVLEDQTNETSASSRSSNSTELRKFRETKLSILLHVDMIMSCFVGSNELPNSMMRKVWGIVSSICEVELEDLRKTSSDFPFCGHKPLTWADRELAGVERICREILASARSDTGKSVEQIDFPLPPSFKSLFRDIVLFLLSISLVVQDAATYSSAAEQCCNAVELELGECETALHRSATEHKGQGDEEFLNESIKTADTLLGLLLQNAFNLSCADNSTLEKTGEDSPYCNLEQIYWRWTSVCHERAIKEASAEMYEEVRRVREELDTITTIYQDQKNVVERNLQLRESPKAKLDTRINKRMQAFLDDMIKHFTTLSRYAEEAEKLTTNSISVSNEDSSKAIYIFTTITVIFLPLNAVSSILGMNVVDIRDTKRGSSLFWEIAVPVTFAVLILCLILVKLRFKFGLRRRVGRWLLMCFPRGWAREHMQRNELSR